MDTTYRMSERNCVEIVTKLIKAGKIALINTEAREFLTHPRLETEIKEELAVQGGRVSAMQLQEAIKVDISHIETKIRHIAESDDGVTLLPPHDNELMTSSYLSDVASDINSYLAQHGSVEISTLATRFNVPVDFLRSVLKERVGSTKEATIKGTITSSGRILTEAYTRRLRARVRGAFRATTRPLSVSNVSNRLGLETRSILSTLRDILDSGEIEGSIQNDVFFPKIFREAQTQEIGVLFDERGYCSYKRAKQMYVKKKELASFLAATDIIELPMGVIDATRVSVAETAIVDAMARGEEFVESASLLPTDLSDKDVSACIDRMQVTSGSWSHGRAKGDAFACCDGAYVVSCALLDKISNAFLEREKTLMEAETSSSVGSSTQQDTSDRIDGEGKDEEITIVCTARHDVRSSTIEDEMEGHRDGPKGKGRRKKKSKKGRRNKHADDDQDEEISSIERQRGKKGRKKNSKNKKGSRRGRHGNDEDVDDEPSSSSSGSRRKRGKTRSRRNKDNRGRDNEGKSTNKRSPSAIWLSSMRKKSDVIDNLVVDVCARLLEHKELMSTVLQLVLPYAATCCATLREQAAREVHRSSVVDQKKLRGDAEKRFGVVWESVLVGAKSIDRLMKTIGQRGDEDDDADTPISRLRRELEEALLSQGDGEEAVACLVGAVALQCGVSLPPSTALPRNGEPILSREARLRVAQTVESYDASVGSELINLCKSTRSRRCDLSAAINAVQSLRENGGCYVRAPNLSRKQEKQILHVRKQAAMKTFRSTIVSADEDDVDDAKTTRTTLSDEAYTIACVRLAFLHAKTSISIPPSVSPSTCRAIVEMSKGSELWGSRSEDVWKALSSFDAKTMFPVVLSALS